MPRTNPDVRLRELERRVVEGDAGSMAPLVVSRVRAGSVNENDLELAWWLSAPLTPPGTPRGPRALANPYNWHPLDWESSEINTPPERFAQAPETLVIHEALVGILGQTVAQRWHRAFARAVERWNARGLGNTDYGWPFSIEAMPDRYWEWAAARGFLISETGGVGNHAPYEIQSEDVVERVDEEEERRVLARRLRIVAEVEGLDLDKPAARLAGGAAAWRRQVLASVSDYTYHRWIVMRAMRKERIPLEILKGLRYASTVEYISVLGSQMSWIGQSREQPKGRPLYGVTEHKIVAHLLGGAPL